MRSDEKSDHLKRRPAVDPAEQSMLALLRAAFKLSVFAAAASFHALAGHGFVKHAAALTFASAICCLVLGHWRREQILAPHLTYFDEAVWFLMLAIVLQAQV